MFTSVSLPTSCLTDLWLGRDGGLVLGNPYGDCWPGTRDLSTTISPATCPSGYTSVYDATPTQDSLEIVWACCPIGYRSDGGVYSCTSDATDTTLKAKTYDSEGNVVITTVTLDPTDFTKQGPNAHSIRVAFHSSDLATTTTISTSMSSDTSRATSSRSPSVASQTQTTATSTPTPTNTSDKGLSAGANAGIGVGAAVGAFLAFSVIAWLIRRKLRARKQQHHEAARNHPTPVWELSSEQSNTPLGAYRVSMK
ncbi:hypothetical protein GGR57DRAFT_85606 [Xylariaceae sp. FL1272]|nr:hypothetical protein GGR57DRAFT_85606 [Xylariaceae sp. FL1272]